MLPVQYQSQAKMTYDRSVSLKATVEKCIEEGATEIPQEYKTAGQFIEDGTKLVTALSAGLRAFGLL